MGKRLNTGYQLDVSNADDEKFLRRLLFNDNNGIAARGQSTLSHDNFGKYTKDEDFMKSLRLFVMEPSLESFKAFEQGWNKTAEKFGARKNRLLVNRVAAACTLEVSTTVDPAKFDQVFYWLSGQKIISLPPESEIPGWYAKNIFLMKTLKDVFGDELYAHKTDDFYLSQFVWMMYENVSNPFSLKKQIIKYGAPGTGNISASNLRHR
ncbi:hypothetical protein [Pontiella sulfatireligans]|nr:hypothetical protein [Pontiella sulfatireligans]